MKRYIAAIEEPHLSKERFKELSREIVRKFNLQDNYEVLVDSTIDKDQPKTILRYKRTISKSRKSFGQTGSSYMMNDKGDSF